MLHEASHLTDEELLLYADGEAKPPRAADIQEHLHACWTCRARLRELERSIADFVELYKRQYEAAPPPIAGPRALLTARLAECSAASVSGRGWQGAARMAVAVSACLLLAALAVLLPRGSALRATRAVPNGVLTPGATNPIGLDDVCGVPDSNNDPVVPDELRREVLKEYGISDGSATAYAIDYLVTPQLGGATSIRNLWPQPAVNTAWNARVKDALEDRLHSMVCSGQLDLATAQREISQNWVAAYKKYFRTNEPIEAARGGTLKM